MAGTGVTRRVTFNARNTLEESFKLYAYKVSMRVLRTGEGSDALMCAQQRSGNHRASPPHWNHIFILLK